MPVKKFTFSKVAGCRPTTLQKMNSFAGIFQYYGIELTEHLLGAISGF